MDVWTVFLRLGVAMGLGLLVGLQRERDQSKLAGIRTFPLIASVGAAAALLAGTFGGWIVGLGALAIAAMLIVGNIAKIKAGIIDPGLTTEMAALLVYAIGAYAIVGYLSVTVALGGATAVLLHYREPLHAFVRRIGERDLSAIMQFVLIALIILPVLPDKAFGPFQVLNPRQIWLMVVLIVGIGLVGYVGYKLFGARAGTLLAGILGGLISSTATTVSYARRTAESPGAAPLAAAIILIASTVAFARVLLEIAVVAPAAFALMAPPLVGMGALMCVLSAGAHFLARTGTGDLSIQPNPGELKSAVLFGILYAVIILAVAATKHYFGSGALSPVAILSGLTDMDAITLSTAQLVKGGQLEPSTGWRLILLASLANLVFKAGVAALLGSRSLRVRVGSLFVIAVVAGLALLRLWP
jgi:uncharacterized membrane protein (DUF4010 family)